MTVTLQGFDPAVANLIQQNVLVRGFMEALLPKTLFRAEAASEPWDANIGDVRLYTRAGVMPINTKPLPPAQDPTPKQYATEQFRVEAQPYGDRLQTHMPTSRAMIASKFALDAQKLGENAGLTLNRITRNVLYTSYLSGDTVSLAAAVSGATVIRVVNCNGFAERNLNGQLTGASAAAPISIQIGPTNLANTVVGCIPDNLGEPFGPGTLYLGTPLGANLPVRSRVRALHRARILRAGGAVTVDGITQGNTLTVDMVINAVMGLRGQNVPPHPDGTYHVHLSVDGATQIFMDSKFTALNQFALQNGLSSGAYRDLVIGRGLGCTFFMNNETPGQFNVQTLYASGANALVTPDIGAEVVNENAVPIARTLITGAAALLELYIPENEYETEAGNLGVVKTFNVTNAGVAMNTNNVRYIIRKPLDVLQRIVDQAWSFSGGWAVPSDVQTGNGARFKRAVCIEHAGT